MANFFTCDSCFQLFSITQCKPIWLNVKDGYKKEIVADHYLQMCPGCVSILVERKKENDEKVVCSTSIPS